MGAEHQNAPKICATAAYKQTGSSDATAAARCRGVAARRRNCGCVSAEIRKWAGKSARLKQRPARRPEGAGATGAGGRPASPLRTCQRAYLGLVATPLSTLALRPELLPV